MKLFLSLQSDSVVVVEIHEGSAVESSAVSLVDLRLSNVQPVPVPMELLEPPKEPPATEKREEIRERLRENALFRRAEILDRSGISVEEASVVALLDAAADEITHVRAALAQSRAVVKAPPTVLEIPAGEGHDPITVIAFDAMPGQGKLIVQCWGDAWTCYFGDIGDRSLLEFVASTESDYLGSKFQTNKKYAVRIAAAVIRAAREHVRALRQPGGASEWVPVIEVAILDGWYLVEDNRHVYQQFDEAVARRAFAELRAKDPTIEQRMIVTQLATVRTLDAAGRPESADHVVDVNKMIANAKIDAWNEAIESAAQACENRAASYTDLMDTSLRNEAGKCASAIRMRLRALPQPGGTEGADSRPDEPSVRTLHHDAMRACDEKRWADAVAAEALALARAVRMETSAATRLALSKSLIAIATEIRDAALTIPAPIAHADTGRRCLADHGREPDGSPSPLCIKCTCGEFVRPAEWARHVEEPAR